MKVIEKMDQEPCWPCEQKEIEKLPPCPLQCGSKRCKSYRRAFEGKPIIWVIGAPGCGKSEQSSKIADKYEFLPLTVRNLVEEEVKSQSVRGKCLAKTVERGEKVPTDLVVDLLKTAIFKNLEYSKGFVIDGYPRDKRQSQVFEKQITPCTAILYLEVSNDVLHKRLGASLENYKEDLKIFYEKNELVLAEYSHKLYSINGELPVQEVFQAITRILDPIVAKKPEPEGPAFTGEILLW